MSQHPTVPMSSTPATNGLGIVGFVLAMVGLLGTGGLLCPVGLIISLIAVGRQPRGFAVAGIVVGLIGSCGGIIVLLAFGASILALAGLVGMAVVLSEPEKVEVTTDMANMAFAIKAYEDREGYLPASLDVLELRPTLLTDPWGNAYRYLLTGDDGPGFELVSAGADGSFGGLDDVKLSELGRAWETGGLQVETTREGGGTRVRIDLSGRSVTATGDDTGGRVTVDLGDRVLEIVGDDVEVHDADPPSDDDDDTGG